MSKLFFYFVNGSLVSAMTDVIQIVPLNLSKYMSTFQGIFWNLMCPSGRTVRHGLTVN